MRGKAANIRANVGETIFDVVDRLTTDLGIELALPPEALKELGSSVREVATDSPEAYRYYVEATHKSYKSFYWRDAIVGYERAVALDSTFAMAYAQLANLYWVICANTGICDWEEIDNNLIKAKEYSGKLTELQKLELEAIDALIMSDWKRAHRAYLEITKRDPQNRRAWSEAGDITRVFFGQPDSALSYYDKAIELDSTFALAYGWKELCYIILEDFEKAEWYADTYLSLAPNEPQANWAYAQFQASQGNIDKMIEYLEKCERIKPGQESEALAAAYIIGRRYEQADSIFSAYITGTDADARKVYRRKIASISMYQGKLDHALSVLDDGIAADRVEKQSDPYKHHIKGRIYMHKNKVAEMLKEFETANDLSDNDSYNYAFHIFALSLNGRTAEAEDSLRIFRTRLDMTMPYDPYDLGLYQWSAGMIKMAKGDADSAIVYLRRAADTFHRRTKMHALISRTYLAKAYLEFGQPADAAREIEIALRVKNVANVAHAIWAAKVHYLAGMIYEELGDIKRAIAQYEEFLKIWKDADPDLEEVPDARRRLALLKEKQRSVRPSPTTRSSRSWARAAWVSSTKRRILSSTVSLP